MFTGKLVRLRAVEDADLDQVMSWINDEEITRYLSQVGQVSSRSQEENHLAKLMRGKDQHSVGFTIETKEGEYLGQGSLHDIDSVSRHAELGVIIGRKELHGQGYGSDAVRLLLRTAWEVLNLEKVYLRVVGGNLQAIKTYERCGFREAVRFHRHCFIHGAWEDDLLMEVFRQDSQVESEGR